MVSIFDLPVDDCITLVCSECGPSFVRENRAIRRISYLRAPARTVGSNARAVCGSRRKTIVYWKKLRAAQKVRCDL